MPVDRVSAFFPVALRRFMASFKADWTDDHPNVGDQEPSAEFSALLPVHSLFETLAPTVSEPVSLHLGPQPGVTRHRVLTLSQLHLCLVSDFYDFLLI